MDELERLYRMGYQDGYADREMGNAYDPDEAWGPERAELAEKEVSDG